MLFRLPSGSFSWLEGQREGAPTPLVVFVNGFCTTPTWLPMRGYPSCWCGLVVRRVSRAPVARRSGWAPAQVEEPGEIRAGYRWRTWVFLWRGTATLVRFSRINRQKVDQESGWLPCEFFSTESPSVFRGWTPAVGTAGAEKRVLGHALCQAVSIITYDRRMQKSMRLPTSDSCAALLEPSVHQTSVCSSSIHIWVLSKAVFFFFWMFSLQDLRVHNTDGS